MLVPRHQSSLSDETQSAIKAIRERFLNRRSWPQVNEETRQNNLARIDRLDVEATRIVTLIEEWFPRRPIPKFDHRNGDLDNISLRKIVENAAWSDVKDFSLVGWPDYLQVVSAEQFDYDLPAYLALYLNHWYEATDQLSFRQFLWTLDLTYEGTVFHRLSWEKRDCVIAFLRFFRVLVFLKVITMSARKQMCWPTFGKNSKIFRLAVCDGSNGYLYHYLGKAALARSMLPSHQIMDGVGPHFESTRLTLFWMTRVAHPFL